MKKGDLAWLPASTSLIQFSVKDKPDSGVKCFCNPKAPTHVLVLGEIEGIYYKVGYRGAVWAVPKTYLYELEKEIRDVG